jgi:hypothetical protein
MPVATSRAAGWYADPSDATLIRYWDGRRWTDRRRPRPSWAGDAGEVDDGRINPRRHWRRAVAAGAVVVVLLAVLSYASVTAGKLKLPPRSVTDTAFTTEANALCRRMLTPLQKARPQLGKKDDPGTKRAVAANVDATAGTLEQTGAQLRALPVSTTNRPSVVGWLDRWDAYTNVGRRYAEALRAGNEHEYTRIAQAGNDPSRDVYLFAHANGMPACSF